MRFVGYDGEIELEGAAIKIKKGKKETGHTVRLADILFVTLKKPVFTMAGCIHIQVKGAKTYSSTANATHYATDLNAICFRKQKYDEAVVFKEALEKAIANNSGT